MVTEIVDVVAGQPLVVLAVVVDEVTKPDVEVELKGGVLVVVKRLLEELETVLNAL